MPARTGEHDNFGVNAFTVGRQKCQYPLAPAIEMYTHTSLTQHSAVYNNFPSGNTGQRTVCISCADFEITRERYNIIDFTIFRCRFCFIYYCFFFFVFVSVYTRGFGQKQWSRTPRAVFLEALEVTFVPVFDGLRFEIILTFLNIREKWRNDLKFSNSLPFISDQAWHHYQIISTNLSYLFQLTSITLLLYIIIGFFVKIH